jgi:hypothetical protein
MASSQLTRAGCVCEPFAPSTLTLQLRCDVVQDPFVACSRCKRCGLDCRIDANFKRVGKRKRNAEMENEIMWLRRQLEEKQASDAASDREPARQPQASRGFTPSARGIAASPLDQYMGSHEAVSSLLDLKTGGDFLKSPDPRAKPPQRLEDVVLMPDQIQELFQM